MVKALLMQKGKIIASVLFALFLCNQVFIPLFLANTYTTPKFSKPENASATDNYLVLFSDLDDETNEAASAVDLSYVKLFCTLYSSAEIVAARFYICKSVLDLKRRNKNSSYKLHILNCVYRL